MNLHDELATLVPLPIPFLDKDASHSMRMISNKQDGMYYLMVRNKVVKSIIALQGLMSKMRKIILLI